MDKKAMSGGMILLIVALLIVAAYMFVPSFKSTVSDLLNPPSDGGNDNVVSKCPSSGLTSVTLNTQEALAATATNAVTEYYVFEKDGTYVTTGSSGSDGQSTFDLACADGKKYDALVINDTAVSGSYGQWVEIDASGPTDTHNLKMYEYGTVNVANIASSIDPAGNSNISAAGGRTCGFIITFSENETASAFNKPLILCQTNVSAVESMTLTGAVEANAKKPSRISASSNYEYHTYEVDTLLKSTDAAQKLSGTITFAQSATVNTLDTLNCTIVDQALYKKAAYQTLKKSEGFVEAAENEETNSDIGGQDSNTKALNFNNGNGYC